MKSNGIVCIDFTKFDSFTSFIEWIGKDENKKYRYIYNSMRRESPIAYSKIFNNVHKIWIMDDYMMCQKDRNGVEIRFMNEIEEFIKVTSIDISDPKFINGELIVDKKPVNKKITVGRKPTNVFISLDIDSILDRISIVGFNGLTDVEKDFLEKNR